MTGGNVTHVHTQTLTGRSVVYLSVFVQGGDVVQDQIEEEAKKRK